MFALTVPMFVGRAWLALTGQIGANPTGLHGGPAAWLAAGAVAFIMFRGFSLLTMDAERGERRLSMLAERDALTGANNRTAFERARTGWRGEGAVLMIDLNRFKALNDRHGHAVGDATLRIATRAAVASVPMTGRVFRWGGDEFVCVLPGAGAPEAAAIAHGIAERFCAGDRRVARHRGGGDAQHRMGAGAAGRGRDADRARRRTHVCRQAAATRARRATQRCRNRTPRPLDFAAATWLRLCAR